MRLPQLQKLHPIPNIFILLVGSSVAVYAERAEWVKMKIFGTEKQLTNDVFGDKMIDTIAVPMSARAGTSVP